MKIRTRRLRAGHLAAALPLAAGALLVGQQALAEPPPEPTASVTTSGDTWISRSPSHRSHGDDDELEVGGGGRARALLAFATSDLLAQTGGRRVVAARLELGIEGTSSSWGQLAFGTAARTVDAHRLRRAWDPAEATWDSPTEDGTHPATRWDMGASQPADLPFEPVATASLAVARGQTGTLAFDVTQDVTAWLSGAAPNHGWLLKRRDEQRGAGLLELASREGQPRPRLVLTLGASAATALVLVSGDGQVARPGEPFAAPIVVAVRDANGAGVAGHPVTFAVAGPAALVPATLSSVQAATDLAGQARVSLQAGAASGPVTVTATAPGLPGSAGSATFRLTVLPPPVTLVAAADTYVSRLHPNRAHGGEARLRVRPLGRNRALVRFDQAALSAALAGATLERAVLELGLQEVSVPDGCGPDTLRVAAHRVTTAWTERGATWNSPDDLDVTNNRRDGAAWSMTCPPLPFVAAPTATTTLVDRQAGAATFDVTADVARYLAGDAENQGWLLKSVREWAPGRVDFSSREGARPPRLLLYTRDAAGPVVAIPSPAEGAFAGPATLATVTWSDPNGVATGTFRATVNGVDATARFAASASGAQASLAAVGSSPSGPLVEGTNTLSASVEDTLGNVGQATRTFVYDSLPPSLALAPPDLATVASESLTVTVTASDAGSGLAPGSLALFVDGVFVPATLVGGVATADLPLAPGPHTIAASIADRAGNTAGALSRVTLVLPRGVRGTVVGGTNPDDLAPLAGARVRLLGSAPVVETFTDALGAFALPGVPPGPARLLVDGGLVGHGRASVAVVAPDGLLTLERPVVLPPVSPTDGVPVLLDATGRTLVDVAVTSSSTPDLLLTIAAGTRVVLPDDGFLLPPGQPLRLSVTRIAGGLENNPLPADGAGDGQASPGVFAFQPEGVEIVEGYTLTLPNETAALPGTTTPIYQFDLRTGAWVLKAQLLVSPDGERASGVLNTLIAPTSFARQDLTSPAARAALGLPSTGSYLRVVGPPPPSNPQTYDLVSNLSPSSAQTLHATPEVLSVFFAGGALRALRFGASGPAPDGLFGLRLGLPGGATRTGNQIAYLDRTTPSFASLRVADPGSGAFGPFTSATFVTSNPTPTLVVDAGDTTAGVGQLLVQYSTDGGASWASTTASDTAAAVGALGPLQAFAQYTFVRRAGSPPIGFPPQTGNLRLRVLVRDTAGNQAAFPPAGHSLRIDTLPPAAFPTFNGPFLTDAPASVFVAASDDFAINRVELLRGPTVIEARSPGGASANLTIPFPSVLGPAQNGTAVYSVRIVDFAGNTFTSPNTQAYTFDTLPPTASALAATTPVTLTSGPSRISFTASDPDARLRDWTIHRARTTDPTNLTFVRSGPFGGVATASVDVDDPVALPQDGTYFYLVTLADTLNHAITLRTNDVVVDREAPVCAIDPVGGLFGPGLVTLRVIASDLLGVDQVGLTIDGATIPRTSLSAPVLLPNGQTQVVATFVVERLAHDVLHQVVATATDRAGLASTASTQVRQDHVAPEIDAFALDQPQPQASATATWTASFSDDGSGVDPTRTLVELETTPGTFVDVTNAAVRSATGMTYTAPALTAGAHRLRVTLFDLAGTPTQAIGPAAFVDVVPPSLSIVSGPTLTYSRDRAAPFELAYSDAGSGLGFGAGPSPVTLLLDGADVTSQAVVGGAGLVFRAVPGVSDGDHELVAQVRDRAGNTTTVSRSFRVDATPPTRPGVPFAGPAPRAPTTTIRWVASSDALSGVLRYQVLYAADGLDYVLVGETTATELVVPSPLTERSRYRVGVVDVAGNVGEPSQVDGDRFGAIDDLAEPVTTSLRVQLRRSDASPVLGALVMEQGGTPLVDRGGGLYTSDPATFGAGQLLRLTAVVDGRTISSGARLPEAPETDFGQEDVTELALGSHVFPSGGGTPPAPTPGVLGLGYTAGEAPATGPPGLTGADAALVAGFWQTVESDGDATLAALQLPPAVGGRYLPVYFDLFSGPGLTDVVAERSTDGGATWAPLTLVGAAPLAGLRGSAAGLRQVALWDAGQDLAPMALADVRVRLYPAGAPSRGDTIETTLVRAFWVESVAPAGGALSVDPLGPLVMTFTREVTTDPVALAAGIVLEDRRTGAAIPVTLAASGRTVTVTPVAPLTRGAEIELVVRAGFPAAGGDPIAFDQAPFAAGTTEFRSAYRVGGGDVEPPVLMGSVPADGASNQPLASTVTLVFDGALDPASIGPSSVTVASAGEGVVPASVVLLPDQRTLLVAPSVALQPGRCYTLSVSPLLRDAAGNALGQTAHVTFSTVSTPGGPAPAPCTITAPVTGTVLAAPPGSPPGTPVTTLVTGTAPPNHAVRLYVNGYPTGLVLPVDATGAFGGTTFGLPPGPGSIFGVVVRPDGLASAPSAEIAFVVSGTLPSTPPTPPGQPEHHELLCGADTQAIVLRGPPNTPAEVETEAAAAGKFVAPTFTVAAANGGGTFTLHPGTERFTGLHFDNNGTLGLTCGGFDVQGTSFQWRAINALNGTVTEEQRTTAVTPLAFTTLVDPTSEEVLQGSVALRARTQEGDTYEVVLPAGYELVYVAVDANGDPSTAVEVNGQPAGQAAQATTDGQGNAQLSLKILDRTQPFVLEVRARGVFRDTRDPVEVVLGAELVDPQPYDLAEIPALVAAMEPYREYSIGANLLCTDEGCPPESEGSPKDPAETGGQEGDPILLDSGVFTLARTDLAVPSPRGPSFVWSRSYKTPILAATTLGHGWQPSYEQRLVLQPSGDVTWVTAGLRVETFRALGGGQFESPGERPERLTVTSGVATIRGPNGGKLVFRAFSASVAPGEVERIVDPDGNALTLTYWQNPFPQAGQWPGRISGAIDATGRTVAEVRYDLKGRVVEVRDLLLSRSVTYEYGVHGDLVRVRSPLLTTTTEGEALLPGQQFPRGRAEVYGYSSGFADERLNHQLRFVVAPAEVESGGLLDRTAAALEDESLLRPLAHCENVYGTEPGSLAFARVTKQHLGGSTTLPAWTGQAEPEVAGGWIQFAYERLPAPPAGASINHPVQRTTVLDRAGNLKEYFHDAAGHCVRLRGHTNRSLRPDAVGPTPAPGEEPAFFERTWSYDAAGRCVVVVNPSGSVWRWVFPDEDLNGDGALTAGADRNGDGDFDDPEDVLPEDDPRYAFDAGDGALDRSPREGRWQWVRNELVPDARGDSRGGMQPRVWLRSFEPVFQGLVRLTDPRGTDPTYRPQNGGVASAARYTSTMYFDYQQGAAAATRTALAAELGVSEAELDLRLAAAGVLLGQGDLNGSSADDGFRAGHVVRADAPSVTLLPEQTALRAVHGAALTIRSLVERNRYGQVVRTVDPERNVHTVSYHPSLNDPAGGGYPSEVVADDSASDPLRNTGTNRPAVRARARLLQDAAGNVVRTIDPRGVEHRVAYNHLFEVVKTRAATAIVGPVLAEPAAAMTALDYEALVFHDADGRVVETRVENAGERDGTAATVATNPYWTRKVAYDLLGNVVRTLAEVEPLQDDDAIMAGSPGVIVGRAVYGPNELVRLVQKPEGNVVAFTYDERDLPFQVTDGFGSAEAATSTFHYTVNGGLQYAVDARKHNPTKWTQFPTGDVARTKRDGFDEVLCTTDPEYNCGDSVYDPSGRRVRHVRHGAPDDGMPRLTEAEFFYDEAGRPFRTAARLFEDGGVFSYATWDRSIPAVGDPTLPGEVEVVSLVEHDALGRVVRGVDPKGDESAAVYDGAGRVVEALGPAFAALTGGASVRNEVRAFYNQAGQPVQVRSIDRSPVGLVEQQFDSFAAFDALGRLVEATDPVGQTSRRVYDSRSLVIAASDARSSVLGVSPRTGFTGLVNGHGNVVHAFFDGLGRPVKSELLLKTGGQGNGQLDLVGAPTGLDLTNPANLDGKITIRQSYDRSSRLVSRQDDNGNTTSYAYDARDRGTYVVGADLTVQRSVYDADSNVVETIDRNGTTVAYTHDGDHRVVKAEVTRRATNLEGTGQGVEGTGVMAWEYDGLSRPRICVDQNDPLDPSDDVATSYTFDSLSRPLTERHRFRASTTVNAVFTQFGRISVNSAGIDKSISRTFDLDSNRTSTTYSSGRTISYGLDGADRIQQIVEGALGAGPAIQTTEWLGGRPLRSDAGNGVRTSFGYDADRRLTSLAHVGALGAGTNVATFGYAWTRGNQRASEIFSAAGLPGATQTYSYDSASRLVRVAFAGGAAPRPDTTWLIDGVGNQVKKEEDGVATALNVRANGRYLPDLMNEVATFTRFDAMASVLGEDRHVQDPNGSRIKDGQFKLYFDAFERLVRVERVADGVVVGRYRYDAAGRRVDRQFRVGGGPLQQVFHVHDGAQEVEEIDGSGAVQADCVWGGLYVDQLVQMRRGGGTYYAHQNSVFSVVALTDASGAVAERYGYSSVYGVCQVQNADGSSRSSASEVGNPWRFQGRRWDPETGWLYFRARFLDPAAGRWVSRDPLGIWGDAGQIGNAYSFCGNDPVNAVDPFGLDAMDRAKAWAAGWLIATAIDYAPTVVQWFGPSAAAATTVAGTAGGGATTGAVGASGTGTGSALGGTLAATEGTGAAVGGTLAAGEGTGTAALVAEGAAAAEATVGSIFLRTPIVPIFLAGVVLYFGGDTGPPEFSTEWDRDHLLGRSDRGPLYDSDLAGQSQQTSQTGQRAGDGGGDKEDDDKKRRPEFVYVFHASVDNYDSIYANGFTYGFVHPVSGNVLSPYVTRDLDAAVNAIDPISRPNADLSNSGLIVSRIPRADFEEYFQPFEMPYTNGFGNNLRPTLQIQLQSQIQVNLFNSYLSRTECIRNGQ